MDEARFTTAQVAKAADMSHANLRAHLSRGNWPMLGEPAKAKGAGHLFKKGDAIVIAIARRLVGYGIEPREAFDLAHAHQARRGVCLFTTRTDDGVAGVAIDLDGLRRRVSTSLGLGPAFMRRSPISPKAGSQGR